MSSDGNGDVVGEGYDLSKHLVFDFSYVNFLNIDPICDEDVYKIFSVNYFVNTKMVLLIRINPLL